MNLLTMTFRCLLAALAALWACSAAAQRQDILLNNDWQFRFSHQVQRGTESRVDLPHTWNAQDALSGKMDYKRGIGNYEKKIFIKPEWQGKRLFLRFEGANSVATVFVNKKFVGEHRGWIWSICVRDNRQSGVWKRELCSRKGEQWRTTRRNATCWRL